MGTRSAEISVVGSIPVLLTVREVADVLGVTTRTVEREIREGKLIPCRIRGARRFRVEDIEAYLAASRERPARNRLSKTPQ